MINDFLKTFVEKPIPVEAEYIMDDVILCPTTLNLLYNVRFVKSSIPHVAEKKYSDLDIITLFEKSFDKALSAVLFYGCEYIYNYNNESFKLSISFEEMKFYQKKNIYYFNIRLKDKKLYDDVFEYITSAGSEGRTLNDVSYKFFRNHRNKQQDIINKLEESGKIIITKIKGLHNKPKTVFIALEDNNE